MITQEELFTVPMRDGRAPARRRPAACRRPGLAAISSYHVHSHEALETHEEALLGRKRLIVAWMVAHGTATDREIRDGINPMWDMNAIRPRVNELLADHRIMEVGERKDPATGVMVRVLAVVK